MAGLADLTIKQLDNFDAKDAARKLASSSSLPEFRERLHQFPQFLEEGRRPIFVAKHFGWESGIKSHIVPTAVMASYCFLRYSNKYRKAVELAIRLGGDTATMGAVVGGLCGANLGYNKLPRELVENLADVAYGSAWMKGMAIRMSQWPHGPVDLHDAHAEPTAVVELTVMNVFRAALMAFNRVKRIPRYLGLK